MEEQLKKLLFDVRKADKKIYNKIAKIKDKATKRKKYLVIDLKEMESIVDSDKVEAVEPIERMEVDV